MLDVAIQYNVVSSCFCSNKYQHRFIAHIITFIHALSTINTLRDNPGEVKGGMVNYLALDSGKHPQRNGKTGTNQHKLKN